MGKFSMSLGPSSSIIASTSGAALSQYALSAVQAVSGHTAYDYDKTSQGIAKNPSNIGVDSSGQFYSYVDCSTWVNYALSSVSPLHAAVIGAERNDAIFNPASKTISAYNPANPSKAFSVHMDQSAEPWPQANVHTYFFNSIANTTDGFSKVADIGHLRAGDLLAWSLGIYADPANPNASSDPTLTKANDTGHVMVVVGPASLYPSPEAGKTSAMQSGLGTDPKTGQPYTVYAVPVVDSSDVPHAHTSSATFAPPIADSRQYGSGDLPKDAPSGAIAGGLGTGTIYFSVDSTGTMQQFRFDANSGDSWHPLAGDGLAQKVVIAAAHLESSIALTGTMLNNDHNLVVNLLSNASPTLGGISYDTAPVTLTGTGGLDLEGAGSLKLTGVNSYGGGTLLNVTGGTLELGNLNAAGTGTIHFGAGAQTLRIDQTGTLANHIDQFSFGDTIDLQGMSYATVNTQTYDAATGTLHIGQPNATMTLNIDAAPAGSVYKLSADSDGSTLLKIVPGTPGASHAYAPFDTALYLAHNPDVAQSGMNPLIHYFNFGQQEGRQAYAAPAKAPDFANHPGFDAEFYLLSNADVAHAAHAETLGDAFAFAYQHYETFGWHEGRAPNTLFDVGTYLAKNADVAAAGIDPLQHYHQFGWHEGRDPASGFHTTAYLSHNPDVAAAEMDPMMHYLQFGAFEGRALLT